LNDGGFASQGQNRLSSPRLLARIAIGSESRKADGLTGSADNKKRYLDHGVGALAGDDGRECS
jgi:hypothetical protein